MKKIITASLYLLVISPVITPAMAERSAELNKQIEQLKKDTKARIQTLEERLNAAENAVATQPASRTTAKQNNFNPAISLILNGSYSNYSQNPDDYALPGFALGSEVGLEKEGFSLGESEITLSANTDQHWRGQMTISLADDNGETSTEVEEAFIETLGLDNGLTVRAGRFFSGIGYLNGKHIHAWNFNDAPLVYRGLFGNQIKQDGLRLNWALPTDQYIELGLETGNGQSFPAGGSHSGLGDWAAFMKTGGDIGDSASWQLGLSHYQADNIDGRQASTHSFTGDSKLNGLDMIYKWSPNGNDAEQSLILQSEYFQRDENGTIAADADNGADNSSIETNQKGWYAEGIYKFKPHWRTGLRYDRLSSSNSGDNSSVLQQTGLLDEGHDPHRTSVMVEWIPSEFSRIRLQANHDNSTRESDNQVILQYTQALGSHGAHQF
ncbi:MAG: hypothetical protein DSZ28_02895 [Thiothrix sp.]|nr:MAG: hypothetical protein DSZ28_02895 [Thiothrix sp.]